MSGCTDRMQALVELAHKPTGTVHDFLELFREAVAHDPNQVSALVKLEQKLSGAGHVYLDLS